MWIVVILAIMDFLSSSQGIAKDISFKLVENCSIGTIVGNINLSADLYVLKIIELRLENSDYFDDMSSMSEVRYGKSSKKLFKINDVTGDLVTISEIDREVLCKLNILKRIENCTILQIVSVNKLIWININIEIIDINDNAPEFRMKQVTLTVSEISKVKSTINLEEPIDFDTEQFRPIRYSILFKSINPFPFQLLQNPLKLFLIQQLDYETVQSYKMIIEACDNGNPSLCGNQTVVIGVINENDESPMFDRSNYTAIINEDAPIGQLVMSPTASDRDAGEYGKLEYSFSSGYEEVKKYFSIDKNNGKIKTIRYFNHPTKYKFSIKATDKAPNPLIGRTWIILHVVDVNNNYPVILVNPKDSLLISKIQNHTKIELLENNKTPCQLSFITVSDQDQGENARCSCQIQNTAENDYLKFFRLVNVIEMSERSIYKLVTEKSFDAEERQHYVIMILCFDYGEPQNSAKTMIELFIKDENEYPPTFDQNIYELYIPENLEPGSIVKTISIYDRDLTKSNIFDLTIPGSMFFGINNSGILHTKAIFDYEKQQKLSFHIVAINRGIKSFTSSAKVLLSILDVNDNAPEFSVSSNKFDVQENIKGHYIVGKIEAFDRDSGKNSKLNYYLLNVTSGNNLKTHLLQKFEVDNETGVIYSNVSLDYEECNLYMITVKVVDNGEVSLNSVQTFYIYVTDVNDNGPVWQYPNIRDNIMNISLQNIRDSVLTRVRAVDSDSDKYNVVHYYLLSHNDVFNINQFTGVVTFKSLNVKPSQMTLHLKAVDADSKSIYSSQILIVYIMDEGKYFLQISLSSSLTFPVMISIIGISSLVSIILVIFVFYFCYRKKYMYRNYNQSSVVDNCRLEDKTKVKFHQEKQKKFDIPLDLVTDNDAFNLNIIEDSMKLILDPLYTNTSSSCKGFNPTEDSLKTQSMFYKLEGDTFLTEYVQHGFPEESHDQKANVHGMYESVSGISSPDQPHNDYCKFHSNSDPKNQYYFESSKAKPCSTPKTLIDSINDTYATFLNCNCSNIVPSDFDSSNINKIVAAPFIFNGSAWIPNTLTNDKLIIQNEKDIPKIQPLKSIMKKTATSFINVDSSSSSGHCNDTDQANSTNDSGCIVGYTDSGYLSPKSIILLDTTYQCKKSQV